MSGLYDRLKAELGDDDARRPAGLTPLDIADLPENQRQVMFGLLRDSTAASTGLPEDTVYERYAALEGLDGILAELTRHGMLIQMGEPPHVRYKVNLRHRKTRTLSANIWASLSDHLAHELDAGESPDDDATRPPRPSLPSMSDW